MYPFSQTALAWLYKSGWKEDRQFDSTEYERLLSAAGYPVHTKAIEFLKSFGGLRIKFSHPRFGFIQELNFVIPELISFVVEDLVQRASEEVGSPLCLIGDFQNYVTVMMDREGKVYGAYNGSMFFIADFGDEAIEAIIIEEKPLHDLPIRETE